MSGTWAAVLLTAVGCYALKVLGLCIPQAWLAGERIQRVAVLLPVALLAALVAVQTLSLGPALTIDARLAGVAAGVAALLMRAPFLVVVVIAAVTAAALRALA